MAYKSKVQLQTDSETVRTETGNKLNTAQRVGQLFRDIVDSYFHQSDSATLTSVKLKVLSADLLTIDAVTPFDLIAAPGTDQGIKIVSLSVTAYASNGYNRDLKLMYDGGETIAILPIQNLRAAEIDIPVGGVDVAENAAIQIGAAGAVSGGTNDLYLNISYIINSYTGYTEL